MHISFVQKLKQQHIKRKEEKKEKKNGKYARIILATHKENSLFVPSSKMQEITPECSCWLVGQRALQLQRKSAPNKLKRYFKTA